MDAWDLYRSAHNGLCPRSIFDLAQFSRSTKHKLTYKQAKQLFNSRASTSESANHQNQSKHNDAKENESLLRMDVLELYIATHNEEPRNPFDLTSCSLQTENKCTFLEAKQLYDWQLKHYKPKRSNNTTSTSKYNWIQHVEQTTIHLVEGYINQIERQFPSNNTYYKIPHLITYTCMQFYCNIEYNYIQIQLAIDNVILRGYISVSARQRKLSNKIDNIIICCIAKQLNISQNQITFDRMEEGFDKRGSFDVTIETTSIQCHFIIQKLCESIIFKTLDQQMVHLCVGESSTKESLVATKINKIIKNYSTEEDRVRLMVELELDEKITIQSYGNIITTSIQSAFNLYEDSVILRELLKIENANILRLAIDMNPDDMETFINDLSNDTLNRKNVMDEIANKTKRALSIFKVRKTWQEVELHCELRIAFDDNLLFIDAVLLGIADELQLERYEMKFIMCKKEVQHDSDGDELEKDEYYVLGFYILTTSDDIEQLVGVFYKGVVKQTVQWKVSNYANVRVRKFEIKELFETNINGYMGYES